MFGELLFFFVRPKIEISYKVKNNRSDKLTCYTKGILSHECASFHDLMQGIFTQLGNASPVNIVCLAILFFSAYAHPPGWLLCI